MTELNEYLLVRARNDGDFGAKDVRLQIGGRGIAYVQPETGVPGATFAYKNEIGIGEFKHGSELTVLVWRVTDAANPSRDPFVLYHEGGRFEIPFLVSPPSSTTTGTVLLFIGIFAGAAGVLTTGLIIKREVDRQFRKGLQMRQQEFDRAKEEGGPPKFHGGGAGKARK